MKSLNSLISLIFCLAVSTAFASNEAGVEALGRGNYELALNEFRPAAELGDVSAQNFLAYTYLMLEDYQHAYAWYHMSAECGSLDADIDRAVLARKMSDTEIERAQALGSTLLDQFCIP